MGDGLTGDLRTFDGTNNINNPMTFKNITSHDLKLGVRWNLESPPVYRRRWCARVNSAFHPLTIADGAGSSRAVLFCVGDPADGLGAERFAYFPTRSRQSAPAITIG